MPDSPPLPGPLRPPASFPFVGRTSELARLRTLLAETEEGAGRVAVLTGAAGSGKSRLIREFAHEAADAGALVLHGACDPSVPAPYGPFVTALEHLERVVPPDELRAGLGPAAGELTRLLPDLPLRVGELRTPAPGAARHRLHAAVVDLLASVSRRQQLLVLIEDAHWADVPTLLLLCHLARFAGDCAMVLVASFEDAETAARPEASAALLQLHRMEGATRLPLAGLTKEEVAEFVRGAGGRDLDATAAAISDLTGGNPFLTTELWRAFVETGELESPRNVREQVRRRVSRLEPETAAVLEAAAVAGPELVLDVVGAGAEVDERTLVAALDEAARAGIVEELAGADAAYRFVHEIVRRGIYDQLSRVHRAELHLRVGLALEGAAGRSPLRTLTDVAHHLAAARPLGDPKHAVDCNLRAARSAQAALAFEQASNHLRAALAVGIDDAAQRAQAQLELGNACSAAGDAIEAIAAYTTAAEIARELGDGDLLAQSAIGLEEACWRPGIVDLATLELLEEAAASLGKSDSSLRIGVLSGLARVLANRGDHGRAAVVRESATEMARRLGDRRELANLLSRAYWARGSTPLEEILEMLDEARDLADELGDLEIQDGARAWRVMTCMALGDVGEARRDLAGLLEIAVRARQPFLVATAEHVASAIELLEGNLDEAETRAKRSRDAERVLSGGAGSGVHGIQMFSIRREQGRLSELAPIVRALAHVDGSQGAWRPGLIALLAELGLHDEARHALEQIHDHGLEPFREALWTASLTYLADASSALRDERTAAPVRRELEAYAGGAIAVGHGVAFYGAADRYLGMLAAVMSDWDDAARHFDSALELNRRMGARTWLAHTTYEYARMLTRRGRAEDAPRAASLLDESAVLAGQIGMPGLLSRIGALRSSPGDSELPDGLSPREVQILRLVARGLSNREIGEELVISEHTAANHIRNILRKTSSANRTEAAGYAHHHGLAGPA